MHDLAVLAALGLPARQLGASIGWQAATFGVIGVVLGIPLGVLVGRIGFRALADTLGVVDVAELPLGAVGAVVAAVAFVTIVAAVGPAIAATRVRLRRRAPLRVAAGPSRPLPTLPAVPLDVTTVAGHVAATWADEIVPALHDYIAIPNVSPAYDAEWAAHGHMAGPSTGARTGAAPADRRSVRRGARLPGRTPVVVLSRSRRPATATRDDTVLLYGHLDKQPEMMGWDDGLGPWTPVLDGDRLYGRGGADDGYAAFARSPPSRPSRPRAAPTPAASC